MKAYDWINATSPDRNGWRAAHLSEMIRANHPMAAGLRAWCSYAEKHKQRFDSRIGDDYVLGPAWAQWGVALRALLNGETGALDCGTCDSIIHDNLREQGFDPDTL